MDFVDGLDLGIAGLGPQEHGELAEAIHAGVIHLGDQDVIVVFKDGLDVIRKGMDVAEVNGADLVTFGNHAVGCFFDGAVGGAPADEEEGAAFFTVDLGGGVAFCQLEKLVAALGRHLFVVCRIAGRVAPFVVFETGHDRIFFNP